MLEIYNLKFDVFTAFSLFLRASFSFAPPLFKEKKSFHFDPCMHLYSHKSALWHGGK